MATVNKNMTGRGRGGGGGGVDEKAVRKIVVSALGEQQTVVDAAASAAQTAITTVVVDEAIVQTTSAHATVALDAQAAALRHAATASGHADDAKAYKEGAEAAIADVDFVAGQTQVATIVQASTFDWAKTTLGARVTALDDSSTGSVTTLGSRVTALDDSSTGSVTTLNSRVTALDDASTGSVPALNASFTTLQNTNILLESVVQEQQNHVGELATALGGTASDVTVQDTSTALSYTFKDISLPATGNLIASAITPLNSRVTSVETRATEEAANFAELAVALGGTSSTKTTVSGVQFTDITLPSDSRVTLPTPSIPSAFAGHYLVVSVPPTGYPLSWAQPWGPRDNPFFSVKDLQQGRSEWFVPDGLLGGVIEVHENGNAVDVFDAGGPLSQPEVEVVIDTSGTVGLLSIIDPSTGATIQEARGGTGLFIEYQTTYTSGISGASAVNQALLQRFWATPPLFIPQLDQLVQRGDVIEVNGKLLIIESDLVAQNDFYPSAADQQLYIEQVYFDFTVIGDTLDSADSVVTNVTRAPTYRNYSRWLVAGMTKDPVTSSSNVHRYTYRFTDTHTLTFTFGMNYTLTLEDTIGGVSNRSICIGPFPLASTATESNSRAQNPDGTTRTFSADDFALLAQYEAARTQTEPQGLFN